MKFFAEHFWIIKIHFRPRDTLHSKSTKNGIINKIKCFWKKHEKILVSIESYFVMTYGIGFIEKIKMLIFEKNFLSEFRFIFRHPTRTPIKCVPLIFVPQYFFFKTMIDYKKHNLSIMHSLWNNEIQDLKPDMVAWSLKG